MNVDSDISSNQHEEGGGGSTSTKIKIKSLNSLVGGVTDSLSAPGASGTPSNMSDVTIGDILEHGDFVSSDESGVMHLKISNVMSVDESITGCTVSEDDKDVFANIQIASVSTLLDDEPLGAQSDDRNKAKEVPAADSGATAPDSDQSSSTPSTSGPPLALINIASLPKSSAGGGGSGVQCSSSPISTMCIVPKSAAVSLVSQSQPTSTKKYLYILRSSLVVPRLCCQCFKRLVCEYRVLSSTEANGATESSYYLCGSKCKEGWLAQLPNSSVLDKPRKYFERVCGMCGHDISEANKGRFSWETREFCNKLCLADHIGYVGQHCRQCKSTVRILHMGKYCVRFGSDIYQFCSNTCLEKYKQNTQVCCYCQKNLASVDSHEQNTVITVANSKKYCSLKCQRRALRKDINQQFYSDKKACTVCTGVMVPRFEFLRDGETSYLCSQPCLNVYKFANSYKAVNCCLCLRLLCVESVTHFLYHNNGQLRVFCSTSCTNVFILSTRRIVTCCFCKVKKYNFDMIQMHDDSAASFYCSVWCLNLHHQKTSEDDLPVEVSSNDGQSDQLPLTAAAAASSCVASAASSAVAAVSAQAPAQSGLVPPAVAALPSFATTLPLPPTKPPLPTQPVSQLTQCNMCQNISPAQFHMVMSDNTLRNFCSYPCASRYKITFGFLVSNKNNVMSSFSLGASPTSSVPAPLPKAADASSLQPPKPVPPPLLSQPQMPVLQKQPVQKPLASKSTPKAGGNEKTAPSQASLRSFRGLKSTQKPASTLEETSHEPFLERILERMAPKVMANKSTMCRPASPDSVSSLLPHPGESKSEGTSTEDHDKVERIFVPVPIPVYVPAPVAMYSLPVPTPIPIPIPVPVPVIISTSAENTESVWRTIEELRKKYGAGSGGIEFSKSPACSETKEGQQESRDQAEPEGKASAPEDKTTAEDKGTEEDREAADAGPTSDSDDAQKLEASAGADASKDKTDCMAGERAGSAEAEAAPSAGDDDVAPVAASPAAAAQKSALDETPLSAAVCSLERSLPAYGISAAVGSCLPHSTSDDGDRGVKRALDDGDDVTQQLASKRPCEEPAAAHTAECVAVWRRWVCRHNAAHHASLPQDPCQLSVSELKEALPLFLAALLDSPNSGRPPRGDTLFCIFLGLQKYFFQHGKQYCFFLDSAFEAFSRELNTAIENYSASFLLPGASAFDTRVCEEAMWQCGLLGAHTPWALLNTLFYFNTKLFRLETVEDHATFSFKMIQKEWVKADGQRNAVLKFSTTHFVHVRDERVKKDVCYEMTENKDDPLRCPVKLYEFYLSKCPEGVRLNSPLYVVPRSDCVPDSAFWYSDAHVTPLQLRIMLSRVLLVCEVRRAVVVSPPL